jgi:hypothetical protein
MEPSDPLSQLPKPGDRTTSAFPVERTRTQAGEAGHPGCKFNPPEGQRRADPMSVLPSAFALTVCGEKFRGKVPWRRT